MNKTYYVNIYSSSETRTYTLRVGVYPIPERCIASKRNTASTFIFDPRVQSGSIEIYGIYENSSITRMERNIRVHIGIVVRLRRLSFANLL